MLRVQGTVELKMDVFVRGMNAEADPDIIEEAVNNILRKQLALLDIRGGRTGDDGYVSLSTFEMVEWFDD